MERSLFKFIWRYSHTQQIITLILILASFPFLYYSLDLPKMIVNKAIGGASESFTLFNFEFFGIKMDGLQLGQLEYLFSLCGIFLALVCINGGFKLKINTYKGVMAERLLRRIRYLLIERALRFPLSQYKKTSSGEIVTMVTAEVEPLGGFFGDAYALLAFQGGTFLTIMAFMFAQDPFLGLAAFISIPVQGYIIPKLQKKVNELGKERVKHVRSLSNRINEVVNGIGEIHAQDHSKFVLSDISQRLGNIFWVRFDIYRRKFFMKFLNNFIGQLTPFFFYAVGGYLVITGDLTFGALVAALAAYKDLAAPWKELLNYYQRMADSKIKYEQIHSQFVPDGMMADEIFNAKIEECPDLEGDLVLTSVSAAEDDVNLLENVNLTLKQHTTTLLTANSGAAREAIAQITARLIPPSKGQVALNNHLYAQLPEAVTGQHIAYLPSNPGFFNRSIADNLFLGLYQSVPQESDPDEDRQKEIEEAAASGNSEANMSLDWLNYSLANAENYDDLRHKAVEILDEVELSQDLFNLGLRQLVQVSTDEKLTAGIMAARLVLWKHLDEKGIADLVRPYNYDAYNDYSTLLENLLFGRPKSERFNDKNFMKQPEILELMESHNLYNFLLTIGLRSAEIMVDMFKGISPGHIFFEQFSFVDEDTLPIFKEITAQTKGGDLDKLTEEQKHLLVSLPLRLIPQRHRLGLLDNRMRIKMVNFRKDLYNNYPHLFEEEIQAFDPDRYNENLSIQDNILFGSIAFGRADAQNKIENVLVDITTELDIREQIIRTALGFEIGIDGSRLSTAQKQKLALARCLLKNPKLVIVNDGLNALDQTSQEKICQKLPDLTHKATTLWISTSEPKGLVFDAHYEIKNARLSLLNGENGNGEEDHATAPAGMGSEAMLLQNLPLFSELEPSQLKLLAFTAQRKHYLEGENIFRQGDDGDTAYVILGGKADVILENEDGSETILFALGRGRLVGELALLCDTKRTATVRASSELTALQLSSDVFAELARQDANFSYQMVRDLSQRLVDTTAELNAR